MKKKSFIGIGVLALSLSFAASISIHSSNKTYHEVHAKEAASYIERSWDEETKTVVSTDKLCESYTVVTESSTSWTDGWYVVNSVTTINNQIKVTGDVNLILKDDTTLTVNDGLVVNKGNSLTIYGQTEDSGKLIAYGYDGDPYDATIGGQRNHNCGPITIHGGDITSTADNRGAAIGGGFEFHEDCIEDDITIYGGKVTASAQLGAGIGSGYSVMYNNRAVVTIYGGIINATNGNAGAAIGGGGANDTVFVYIHGGDITANSSGTGAAIGGGQTAEGDSTIVISGGKVNATSTGSGAGIGNGNGGYKGNAYITISGGEVSGSSAQGEGIGRANGGGTNNTVKLTVTNGLSVIGNNDSEPTAADIKSAEEYELGPRWHNMKVGNFHTHDWSYTANGASITASCSAADCPVTEGLTLTLKAPTGDMTFSGDPKEATLEAGYSNEAFPDAENKIKYYKGDTEVDECVYAGDYTARITFGDATASVNFTINNYKTSDPTSGVALEVLDKEVDDDLRLEVEVKPTDAIEEHETDYTWVKENYLLNGDEILYAYDVKLIRSYIDGVSGEHVEEEIQPEDIAPGTLVRITMGIPEFLLNREFRILQIHSANSAEYVGYVKAGNNSIYLDVPTISEFAFVGKKDATPIPPDNPDNPGGGNSKHGFCIGVILLIINILVILVATLYILLRLGVFKKIAKMEEVKEKITAQEVLLTFIATCALIANFLLDLIVLIVHTCPLTVVSFILGILLLGGIMFWYIRTRRNGEMTPIEEKSVGKIFKKKETETDK